MWRPRLKDPKTGSKIIVSRHLHSALLKSSKHRNAVKGGEGCQHVGGLTPKGGRLNGQRRGTDSRWGY